MKVSIVTVCYNSEKTIKDTLESVLKQTYNNIEYIIIDGLSKDNTLNIIKEYQKKFNNKMIYISESDKGIYDAMNKGIKLSTGDIVGILNSDDILADEKVIERIVMEFEKSKCDCTYSDLVYKDENTMTFDVRRFNNLKETKKIGWHPPHPTLYLKRTIYEDIGYFNISYKIAADYDFMIRLLKENKYKLSYIKETLIYMRAGGVSTNGLKGYYENFKESYVVLKNNKIKFPLLCNIKRTVKTLIQMIRK